MARQYIQLTDIDEDSLKTLLKQAIMEATEPLRTEVTHLRERMHKLRPVVTHREAVELFGGDVTPDTIIRYIKEEGLPASKQGRLYFIKLDDLFAWQTRRAA